MSLSFLCCLETAASHRGCENSPQQRSTAFILVFSLTQAASMSEVENLRQHILRIKGLPTPASFSIGDSSQHDAPKARRRRPEHIPGGGRTNYRRPAQVPRSSTDESDEDGWSIGENLGEGYHHVPAARTKDSVPFVIVGTKCDLVDVREVSREMAIR